jgi:hypothetical protein
MYLREMKMRWAEHVACMVDENAYGFFVGELKGKRNRKT